MTAKLYYGANNQSLRKLIHYMNDNNVPFEKQCVPTTPLSWDQFAELLEGTIDGAEDIIASKSKAYTMLTEQGVDIEGLTLKELHRVVCEHPTLLKSPVITTKGITLIGYSKDEVSMLIPRDARKEQLDELIFKLDSYYPQDLIMQAI